MRRGTKFIIASIIVAALIGGVIGFAFFRPTLGASQGFDFETLVKLNVYQNADEELGVYLEDDRYSTAASWAFDVISETARRQNVTINSSYTPDIIRALGEGFATLGAGGYIETDGLGHLSEGAKSHIANMAAAKLFEICPSLTGVELTETAYQGYNNSITNTESVGELKTSLENLKKQLEALGGQSELYSFVDAMVAAEGEYNGLTVVARKAGEAGNSIRVEITPDISTEYAALNSLFAVYKVETFFGDESVDVQTIGSFESVDNYTPAKIGDLKDNTYVLFKGYENELISTPPEGIVIELTGGKGSAVSLTASATNENTKAISELQTELAAIETLINNLEYGLNDKIDKYALTGDLSEYASAEDLAGLNTDLLAQFDSITSIETRIAELYRTISANRDAYGDSFTSIQQEVYNAITLVESLKQEVSEQLANNTELSKNIDDVTAELLRYKTEIEIDITQIDNTIKTLDSTVNATIASKYADLEDQLAKKYATLNESLTSTKTTLTNDITSVKNQSAADLEATKRTLQQQIEDSQNAGTTELERFKTSTNNRFADVEAAILALSSKFSVASETTTSLIESIITQGGTLDSTGLLSTVTSNATALTQELTGLHDTLTELNEFVEAQNLDPAKTQALTTEIASILAKVTALEAEVEDYSDTMTTRINSFDQTVIDAVTNISDSDSSSQQALVEATNVLLSLQKANDVYIKRLLKKAATLDSSVTTAVSHVKNSVKDIQTANELNQSISDNVDAINQTIQNLSDDVDSRIETLNNNMSDVINNYIASLQEADNAIVEGLNSQMTIVSALQNYTIETTAWEDTIGGDVVVNLPITAINSGTQHIDIQYEANYGIEPSYGIVELSNINCLSIRLPRNPGMPITLKQVLIYSYPEAGHYTPSQSTATPASSSAINPTP